MVFVRKLLASPSLLVPTPLPCRREAHFWYIVPDEVRQTSLLSQYVDLLSPCEREDVFSMKEEKLQKRALLARVLVRSTLARYTNLQVNPRSLNFKKNIFGKPEVEWQHFENWDPPSLHFNLSHSSSLIACGVAVDMPIGIDVEEKERKLRNNVIAFARRYFSPSEVDYLQGFSEPEIQSQEFVKLWTLKEAYVKALGRGFSATPFSTFTIQFRAIKGMQNLGESCSDVRQCFHSLQYQIQPPGFSFTLSLSLLLLITFWACLGVPGGLHSARITHMYFAEARLASFPEHADDGMLPTCIFRHITNRMTMKSVSEIVLEVSDNPEDLRANWKFALFELSSSHYAAVCMKDNNKGNESTSLRLKVWKTIPFVKDECVSGTDAVTGISGCL